MAKWQNDTILDQALSYIANNVTELYVCSSQPADRAAAIAAALATKTGLTSGSFTGPANGDSSGRKITVNQQASIPVAAGGTATHVALCSGSVLLYVTTCTSQALSSGNTVTVPAWDIEIADAA